MAKTLVIKNADFSANALDTVSFGTIDCTGITLDNNTLSFADLEVTGTLTATVTPSNCTDTVYWTSSDTTIASVSDGVVTSHRLGTVTITATCGNYTATCTVTIALNYVDATNTISYIDTNGSILVDAIRGKEQTTNRNVSYAAASRSGVYPVSCAFTEGNIANLYPIPIPEGATTITVNPGGSGWASIITYFNDATASTADLQDRVRDSAKVLDGETPTSGTDWSISSWTYGERTYTIPNIDGINSFALNLHSSSTTIFEQYDASNVAISFGYE